ncbi:NAD(P)/FAD-dependent oxidoreductase [Streptomyces sp. NPDC052042]|uniref:NAD(P)/FAD-dependent oxidoreductase n=1 Tax=Streptomyces sp. NPDC052042 TaxID=3365683 RepID=UPI0037D49017
MSNERVVVIGGSVAGASVVNALARGGRECEVTLVSADPQFPPYDPPPLSKEILSGAWPLERARFRTTLPPGARVRTGTRAVGLDPDRREVFTDDGAVLGYDRLVLATGSRPRELRTGAPLPPRGVHRLRTVADALALRDALRPGGSLLVVGAGLIGCEVAATAVGSGMDVTVVDPAPLPLLRMGGEPLGAFMAARHREHGVRLFLGSQVREIIGEDRVTGAVLDNGTHIPCDAVLMGIGAVPETEWLAGSGLPVDDGVVCDATCTVAGVPEVMAVGDVARWHSGRFGGLLRVEHWTNAVEQAAHAGRNLFEEPERRTAFDSVPYAWSVQYGLRVQVLGLADTPAAVVQEDRASGRLLCLYGGSDGLRGVVAVGRPEIVARARRAIADRTPVDALSWAA